MARIPITTYRPVLSSDGEGGLFTALANEQLVYVSMTLHKNQLVIIIDPFEDVIIEDILCCKDELTQEQAFYRANLIIQPARSRNRIVQIERMDRPLWPLTNINYLFYNGQQLFYNGQPLCVE